MHTSLSVFARQSEPFGTMVEDTQEALRGWIERILEVRKWTKTHLAKEAGVAQTTITRLFRDDYLGAMNSTTVAKIASVSGISAPRNLGLADSIAGGFREPEVTPLASPALVESDPHVTEWLVGGGALTLAGYVAGDRIWVHDSMAPEQGDVVLAQVYNLDSGTAETVMRLFNPPYLTTASISLEDRKPLLIDGERVLIRGVIIRSERQRRIR